MDIWLFINKIKLCTAIYSKFIQYLRSIKNKYCKPRKDPIEMKRVGNYLGGIHKKE